MDFSIIIPTKNRAKILAESLVYVLQSIENYDVEVIVINDGDENITLSDEILSRIKIYKNPKSGVASARNLGARISSCERLIFMDDDMWMQKDNLPALEKAISIQNNSCINLNWTYPPGLSVTIKKQKFGRYLEHYGFTSLKGWSKGLYWDDENMFKTEGITSQFLFIPKQIFETVGGYNEEFPHAGFEDYDFAIRLKKMGVPFYIYPKSFLFHNEADRVDAKNWLARKMRGGETRKYAVAFGYKHLELNYNIFKKIIYKVCILSYPILFFLEDKIPNYSFFDKIYFKLINLLFGAHSYEGYQKNIH